MYPINATVKALFDAEQTHILRITGTDKNGASISITDADIDLGGFNVDRFSCNGEKLEIGTATAAQLELKLNNGNGTFDNIVFEGAELFVEIGIADWSASNPTIYYIPCGYFTPDQQPRKLTTISLKALDRMTKFDHIVDIAALTFPDTIAGLVSQVCTICSVTNATTLTAFPNYDYSVTTLPDLQTDITYRNIIQWCAGIMGTCAFIDWNGELQFKWYSAASYTTTIGNRYSSDIYENAITITGVKYTNTQNVTIVSGTDDYALDMTGNYLAASGIATILPNVNMALNGFSYYPFSATVISAPYLWPLDVITFTDKDGNNYSCIITNVNFNLNGNTNLQGKGQTEQLNSGTIGSNVTPEMAFLVEQAVEVVNELDESLNQQSIFNRLTDNGIAQGLYLVNGQLYINMSYARAGTLVLGGLNNQNGLLQVQDASGNVIGTWDNDGISLTRGAVVFNVANNANNTIKINGIDDVAAYRRALLIRYQYGNDDPIRTLLDRGVMQIETYDGAGESDIVTIRPGKIILNTGDADDTVQINLLGYSDYIAPGEQNSSFGEAKLFLYNDRMYMTLQDLNTYNDVTWFELNVANRTLALTGDASISGSLTLGTPLPISGGGTGANAAAGALGNLGGAPCVKLGNSLTWTDVYNAFAGHANQTVATFFASNPSLLTGGKVTSPVFGIVSISNKTNGNYDFMCSNANGAYIYHWRISGLTSASATPTVGTVYSYTGTAM